MCTALTLKTKDFYFGRTLDYEFSYGEEIVVTPRNYPIHFRYMGVLKSHYAIIGMAHVAGEYPLYYDAVNEKGVGMAGLNFVGNAHFSEEKANCENVATYEFILWILGQCGSLSEVKEFLGKINLTGDAFSKQMPAAPLHWIIADKSGAVTVEATKEKMTVYDNPVGVLTNNPPFDIQMFLLNNYMSLSPKQPSNNFAKQISLQKYSRGMGALGLPGDLSSTSRFAKIAFTKMNSVCGDTEEESVGQFFHVLSSVEQQKGCCEVEDGKYEYTIYTSCCNADKGIYYYTTYENRQICAVDMHRENPDGENVVRYPLIQKEQILWQQSRI